MNKTIMMIILIMCASLSSVYAMPKAELQAGAKAGNAETLVEIGEIYTEAQGVCQFFNMSLVNVLQKEQKEGFSRMAETLLRTQRLTDLGLECIFQAAIKGNLQAQYDMVFIYKNGSGVEKNLPLANALAKNLLPRLIKSVDDGDLNSEGILGNMYLEGVGIEKNEEKGIAMIEKSANHGNMESKTRLAHYYFEKGDASRGLPLLKEAAEQGYRGAQYSLGYAYNYGEHGLAKDKKSSSKWLQAAADQGDLSAEILLHLTK